MSEENKISSKRSHQSNGSAFPDDLEIPESALNDRKFLSAYVHILNDPRVYKRQRLDTDRTSSRFETDYNYQIKVVYNEPIIKRKSILANTDSPKDGSGTPKSVSFVTKVTYIDSNDLNGGSSDWSDVEEDEKVKKPKNKKKSKVSKEEKTGNNKKRASSNDKPSSKKHKKNEKTSNKTVHKTKPVAKELFKFKITKPFRKFGRSKEHKLKHLQKKFGRRMFKAFVHVNRSFNLKNIPDKVSVPLEKITLKTTDVTTPEKSVPSIQDFLIGQLTKKVKVSLTPVQDNTGDTNEERIDETHSNVSSQSDLIESNSTEEIQNSKDDPVDRQEMIENTKTSSDSTNSDQANKINGDLISAVPAETDDSPDMVIRISLQQLTHQLYKSFSQQAIVSCNDTEPSLELVQSNPLPNKIDKITCNMYYNTNKDETATMNGQRIESNSDNHVDLVDTSLNVSFSMPTKSLTDDILSCDSSEIPSIQLLND